ncbi:polysaccharide deacetylase [Paracandidimonas soli]|uniref:Polysaccharide deacetylase n=2 Tax=Paracandidimonas soli TaxID=1917182 RepID=A0A4R3V9Q8_9BURK|nr:polysaccharide deacetylase [Paracandidimonas soli]
MGTMIPILMYHQVGVPAPKGTPFRGLTVAVKDFQRQMTWLSRLGYKGVSMADLMPYLSGEKRGKVVGITFDDGYCNVLEHAAPILNRLGFTSTNYFVADQLGGSNVWDHGIGVPPSPLMTADQIRKWAAAGQEVGSHTLDHPHLPLLGDEQALHQMRQSKAVLESIVDREVSAFCYPYGDESMRLRQLAREAGYANATTTARGLAKPTDDVFGLPRVTVARSTHIVRFLQKCLTRLEERKGGRG